MLETSLPLIAGLVIALFAAFIVLRAVRIVPQARARNVERLGRYKTTPGYGRFRHNQRGAEPVATGELTG